MTDIYDIKQNLLGMTINFIYSIIFLLFIIFLYFFYKFLEKNKNSKKKSTEDFSPLLVKKINNTNRLGIVIFSGKPFTAVPLTFDYNLIKNLNLRTSLKTINQESKILQGSAIGDSLLFSKTLFKKEKRGKVILLLTYGNNTSGIEINKTIKWLIDSGIKVYVIGVGSEKGGYIIKNNGFFKTKEKILPLNEKPLIKLAKDTGGKYFRADNNNSFENIFKQLNKLEKNYIEVKIKKEYSDYYKIFLYSLIILIGSFSYLVFRSGENN